MIPRLATSFWIAAIACVPLTTAATDADAQSMRTQKFAQAGNWRIQSVTNASGTFNHCSARVTYRSGMQVFLIAFNNGVWSIQFFRKDWPKRKLQYFPVTLQIDGRTVMKTRGKFRGRSAFVELGTSARRVRAFMKGRVMSVISPSGVSKFKLTGTFRAAKSVARCWDRYREVATARRNDGAFGSAPRRGEGAFGTPRPPNDGAFGGGSTAPERKARPEQGRAQLGRDKTMRLARRYLTASQKSYEILPGNKNVFKNFPVNWRYESGQLGGMMILQSSRFDAESGLNSLIGDQRKWCKGSNAFERRATQGAAGRRLSRARGICRMEGKRTVVYDYSVAELSNKRIMMIIEAVSTARRTRGAQDRRPRDDRPDADDAFDNSAPAPPPDRTTRRRSEQKWQSRGANDI